MAKAIITVTDVNWDILVDNTSIEDSTFKANVENALKVGKTYSVVKDILDAFNISKTGLKKDIMDRFINLLKELKNYRQTYRLSTNELATYLERLAKWSVDKINNEYPKLSWKSTFLNNTEPEGVQEEVEIIPSPIRRPVKTPAKTPVKSVTKSTDKQPFQVVSIPEEIKVVNPKVVRKTKDPKELAQPSMFMIPDTISSTKCEEYELINKFDSNEKSLLLYTLQYMLDILKKEGAKLLKSEYALSAQSSLPIVYNYDSLVQFITNLTGCISKIKNPTKENKIKWIQQKIETISQLPTTDTIPFNIESEEQKEEQKEPILVDLQPIEEIQELPSTRPASPIKQIIQTDSISVESQRLCNENNLGDLLITCTTNTCLVEHLIEKINQLRTQVGEEIKLKTDIQKRLDDLDHIKSQLENKLIDQDKLIEQEKNELNFLKEELNDLRQKTKKDKEDKETIAELQIIIENQKQSIQELKQKAQETASQIINVTEHIEKLEEQQEEEKEEKEPIKACYTKSSHNSLNELLSDIDCGNTELSCDVNTRQCVPSKPDDAVIQYGGNTYRLTGENKSLVETDIKTRIANVMRLEQEQKEKEKPKQKILSQLPSTLKPLGNRNIQYTNLVNQMYAHTKPTSQNIPITALEKDQMKKQSLLSQVCSNIGKGLSRTSALSNIKK